MYFVGVDIGTSSTKAVVFDASGVSLGTGAASYEVQRAPGGHAEQDPEAWWRATVRSVAAALANAGVNVRAISGIGLSGQMHGMVVLDADGVVLRPAIIHSDVRSGAEVAEVKAIFGSEFFQITRNPVFSGFQAVSLYWMARHEPDMFKRVRSVLCPKDYVRFRLTGKLGTEHTDASATLLYDLERQEWSDKILAGLALPREVLPQEIGQPFEIAGYVTPSAAAECGLPAGTPVVYGGADQAMHSVGNGVFTEDTAMATTGSSGQVLMISSDLSRQNGQPVHTFRHVEPGHFYGLAGVLAAGNALSWFRSKLVTDVTFDTMARWVGEVPPGSDGLVFLPCLDGERTPYMDADARAIFLGISALHDRRHFARAVMEGVAYAMKSGYDVLASVYGERDILVCAGGATRTGVWSQIQADVFGRQMSISHVAEQGCLGAAIMASLGTGHFNGLESACRSMCDQNMQTVYPRKENLAAYEALYQRVYTTIYENNAQAFVALAELTAGKN